MNTCGEPSKLVNNPVYGMNISEEPLKDIKLEPSKQSRMNIFEEPLKIMKPKPSNSLEFCMNTPQEPLTDMNSEPSGTREFFLICLLY